MSIKMGIPAEKWSADLAHKADGPPFKLLNRKTVAIRRLWELSRQKSSSMAQIFVS
jgi:hypothetical protein